jgi:hypothetical protein
MHKSQAICCKIKHTGADTRPATDDKCGTNLRQGAANVHKILKYLKDHGEHLDAEIAKELGIPLANVSSQLSELASKGDVIMCHTTRFTNGKKVEGMLCRAAGYIPPASPGRKPKAPT